MKTILYLTTNGLAEPLGRSQILPYLVGLSKNYKIIVLSSEKKTDLKNYKLINSINNLVGKNNIIWDQYTKILQTIIMVLFLLTNYDSVY